MKKTYYTVDGEILGEKAAGGQRLDYLTDALGNVTATVNQSGQVVNTYKYKPYGALLQKTGSGSDPSFQWVGAQGYRQTGKKYSDVYIRARHYDTLNGRWTTKDPFRFAGTDWNLFRYVGNQPSSFVDPSGLQPQPVTCVLCEPVPSVESYFDRLEKLDKRMRDQPHAALGNDARKYVKDRADEKLKLFPFCAANLPTQLLSTGPFKFNITCLGKGVPQGTFIGASFFVLFDIDCCDKDKCCKTGLDNSTVCPLKVEEDVYYDDRWSEHKVRAPGELKLVKTDDLAREYQTDKCKGTMIYGDIPTEVWTTLPIDKHSPIMKRGERYAIFFQTVTILNPAGGTDLASFEWFVSFGIDKRGRLFY